MPKGSASKTTASHEPKYHIFLYLLVFVAFFGILSVYFFNFSSLRDLISNLGYTPSDEIITLEEKIGFTKKAKTTFRATRPALESRESFNDNCKTHDQEISVLGCYTANRIHLYDIKSDELSGIVESTAAHEFLHAAWDRLPEAKKNEVSVYLLDVYAAHRDMLESDLAIYDDEEQLDELHSRVGVQIADLPEYLEDYYATYFENQDSVVSFYDHYIAPFDTLQSEISDLKTEIDAEKDVLDERTAEYYQRAEDLSARIDEFNSCLLSGCFSDVTSYEATRQELVDEQSALEEMYNNINADVTAYNEKISQYNQNILRTEDLQNAINSNAQIKEIENE